MEAPQIPSDLPNVKLGAYTYEQGFEEKLLINSEYADCFQCAICQCIPRQPVSIKQCGHCFCECCIEKQLDSQSKQSTGYSGHHVKLNCQICKVSYTGKDLTPFEQLPVPLRKAYRLMKLKCPYGCPFTGDPQKMDEHQGYDCELREVKCPSIGCEVILPFHLLRDQHIAPCDMLMIYCTKCFLPVKREMILEHNCMERLARALLGILIFFCLLKNLIEA